MKTLDQQNDCHYERRDFIGSLFIMAVSAFTSIAGFCAASCAKRIELHRCLRFVFSCSKVHRYKPFSMPTLQTRAPAAACAVRGVPSVIAATKPTNAHANSRELAIVLSSFVFIDVVSFCLICVALALFGFLPGEVISGPL